jgi:hypothetical protein
MIALRNGKTITPLDRLRIAGTFKTSSRLGEACPNGIDPATGRKLIKGWKHLPNRKSVRTYKLA